MEAGEREGCLSANYVSELFVIASSCENTYCLSSQMDLALLTYSYCYQCLFQVSVLAFTYTETTRTRRMHRLNLFFAFQDFLFHGATFVFYFGAFLLQAATTSLHYFPRKFNSTTHEKILADHEYNISIAASVCTSLICIWGQKSVVSPCSQLLKMEEVIVFESSKYFHSGMQKILQ